MDFSTCDKPTQEQVSLEPENGSKNEESNSCHSPLVVATDLDQDLRPLQVEVPNADFAKSEEQQTTEKEQMKPTSTDANLGQIVKTNSEPNYRSEPKKAPLSNSQRLETPTKPNNSSSKLPQSSLDPSTLDNFLQNWAMFHHLFKKCSPTSEQNSATMFQNIPENSSANPQSARNLAQLLQALNLEIERQRQVKNLADARNALRGFGANYQNQLDDFGWLQHQQHKFCDLLPAQQFAANFRPNSTSAFPLVPTFPLIPNNPISLMKTNALPSNLMPPQSMNNLGNGHFNPVSIANSLNTVRMNKFMTNEKSSDQKQLHQIQSFKSKITKTTNKFQMFGQSSNLQPTSSKPKRSCDGYSGFKHVKNPLRTANSSTSGMKRVLREQETAMDCSDTSAGIVHLTENLTATHLRKAKLMFFYQRYPNSAILRQYFVDVKFNRSNNAQLIKWFSNFREYYYIQIEKHVREALQKHQQLSKDNNSWPSLQFPQSNYTNCPNVIDLHDTAAVSRSGQSNTSFKIESLIGGDAVACQEVKGQDLRSSDEVSKALSVDRQSEVFRNLNTHYNKSSAFEAPEDFVRTVNVTIQHFALSIMQGRDRESGWKKQIYKVISKLDAHIPETFKSCKQ